jgi:hypothetical protein
MNLRSTLFLAVMGLACLPLLASDTGNTSGVNDNSFSLNKGQFTMTVTEDGTETTFSGGAVFGIGSEAWVGQEAVVVYMLEGAKKLNDDGQVVGEWTEMILWDRENVEIPSQGDWNVSRLTMRSRTIRSSYGASSGTVEVTSVSDSTLKGTFAFSVPSGATIEGTFTADRTDRANRVICAPDCEDA